MEQRLSDFERLREFVRRGDQRAFESVVRQHLDLVYGTALRKVGDAGAAEEMAQNVFSILARKAWRFAPEASVPAWLHRTTLLESQAWLRGEFRRRHREQVAAEFGTTMKTPDEEPAFASLVPLLDDALLSLRETDRTALLLRYYEGQSLREVGDSLGVREDAARKRVQGALEKLSQFFQRRGFKTATAAVAAVALERTTVSASAATAGVVVNAALHSAPSAIAGLTPLLARFTGLMLIQKAAVFLALAALLLICLSNGKATLEKAGVLTQTQWAVAKTAFLGTNQSVARPDQLLLDAIPSVPLSTNDVAEPENPLPRILRDWAKRRQDTSMITYRLSGTITWPKGGFTELSEGAESTPANAPDENPPKDLTGKLSSRVILDFKHNRCRVERESDGYNNANCVLYHLRVTEVGNGGISYVHVVENTDNARTDPNSNQRADFVTRKGVRDFVPAMSFELDYLKPLFFASGVVSTDTRRVKTVDFSFENDPSAFVFEGYATEQGRRLAILRVDFSRRYSSTQRYWIDTEHDSAIVKYTYQLGADPGDLLTCAIQYGLTAGLWLPNQWSVTQMRKGKAFVTKSNTVSEATILTNLEPKTFILNPSPGMFVKEDDYRRDPETKGMVVHMNYYRLDKDGSKSEQSSNIYVVPQPGQ